MGIKEKVIGIFKRKVEEEKDEDVIEVDEIIEKAKDVSKKSRDVYEDDPWKEFKVLCKDVGANVTEVIHKLAWDYIEETGITSDPLSLAKEYISGIKEVENVINEVSEPTSVKKLRKYKEALKEVKEFKEIVEGINTKKITPADVLPILTNLMKKGGE